MDSFVKSLQILSHPFSAAFVSILVCIKLCIKYSTKAKAYQRPFAMLLSHVFLFITVCKVFLVSLLLLMMRSSSPVPNKAVNILSLFDP